MKSAIVITPTTGAPVLADAAKSVLDQSYKNLDYLVVVDGPAFAAGAELALTPFSDRNIHKLQLPFNTGARGFYGHRIISAMGHLVNHDYILFLDQDNWLDPSHVESLVEQCEKKKLAWSFSLRKIFTNDMQYVCDDNCESLGVWPTYDSTDNYLIDTSAYCFSREFLQTVGHLWHFGWGADRRFSNHIRSLPSKYSCSTQYSLNYRLGGNPDSVTREYFDFGNAVMAARHGDKFPWLVDK